MFCLGSWWVVLVAFAMIMITFIQTHSKGGQSTLDNCRALQARVNRSKGNCTEYSLAELIQKSYYCRVSGRDMDLLELSAYGNVQHEKDTGGGC